ncbi:hypothetical protein Sjap_014796 [Stephania japonica]|uniref:Pentatricopeptide repeat-containing protein n=1 Tax=Stephania japonica TaxID=461633 RepID=A0AAP0IHZ2_9MAGN
MVLQSHHLFALLTKPFSSSSSSSSPWFPILRSLIAHKDILLGQRAHAQIIVSGQHPDRFLSNNLINMYSKCGSLFRARQVFDKMPQRDYITWNSVLAAYALAAESDHGQIEDGFRLFRRFRESEVAPTKLTLAPVLKLCLLCGWTSVSEAVHGYAVRIGMENDVYVSGALVNVYSKFGRVDAARRLFDEMPERDVVLWNVMIKGYMQSRGLENEAFCLFAEFHRSGLCPDGVTIRCILGESSGMFGGVNGELVEQVIAYAIKISLLDEYSDAITWNKMMSKHMSVGNHWGALECFGEMRSMNVEYDNVTFIVALSAVMGTSMLETGMQIHGMIVKVGFDSDTSIANNLINMYAKIGLLDFAQMVFDDMEELDLISWNSMISSFAWNGLERDSITLFLDLLKSGIRSDEFTLATILRACSASPESFHLGRQVHVLAVKMDTVKDDFVLTALIDFYGKNAKTKEAEILFNRRVAFDLASWNAMMAGFITNNEGQKALHLFSFLHKCGEKLNQFTFATVIKACGSLVSLDQGKQLHANIIKLGFDFDLCVSSGILDMYMKCGEMEAAAVDFDSISEPDDVAWTAMISGYVENGEEGKALQLYRYMRRAGVAPDEYTFATLIKACSGLTAVEQGRQIHGNAVKLGCVSDHFVGTSLVDMYAKCGCIQDSYKLFMRINVRSIAVWNAMIVSMAQHGNGEEALNLFSEMQAQGVQPDGITFIGVLSACNHSGFVSEAYKHFDSMDKVYGVQPEAEHYSCLIDVLGRSGLVKQAEELIKTMPFKPTASMYRALLGACRVEGVQGDAEIGMRVASRLLALEPFDSTAYVFLSKIYAAADRWDMVTDARKIMKEKNVKKDPALAVLI